MNAWQVMLVGVCCGVGLSTLSCGTTTCSVSTCKGCCDASGRCQLNQTALQCGSNGAACVACEANQRCTENVCVAVDAGVMTRDAGTITPDAGVDAGLDAGARDDGGCRLISTFVPTHGFANYVADADAGYDYTAANLYRPSDPPQDIFVLVYGWSSRHVELLRTPPTTVDFSAQPNWSTCATCAIYYEGCGTSDCDRSYLGVMGSLRVTTAPRTGFISGVDAGPFTAAVTDVLFREWDFDTDEPVDGGACLRIGASSFSVRLEP